MSIVRKWTELASQNERLAGPADRPAESSRRPGSADPQPRREGAASSGSGPEASGPAEPPLARSA